MIKKNKEKRFFSLPVMYSWLFNGGGGGGGKKVNEEPIPNSPEQGSIKSDSKKEDEKQSSLLPEKDLMPQNLGHKTITPTKEIYDLIPVQNNRIKNPTCLKFDQICCDDYQLVSVISNGTFGLVVQAFNTNKVTKDIVAIKIVAIPGKDYKRELSFISSELHALYQFKGHPNIVRMIDLMYCDRFCFIVMDYYPETMLELLNRRTKLSEPDSRHYYLQLIGALEYMFSNGWVHRDVKLENILVNDSLKKAVLSDFGLSSKYDQAGYLKDSVGSLLYSSPEILKGQPYIGPEVDIWSSGVVLYMLVSGTSPFYPNDSLTEKETRSRIVGGKFSIPAEFSTGLSSLVCLLLHKNRLKRINIEEIKNHKWIQS